MQTPSNCGPHSNSESSENGDGCRCPVEGTQGEDESHFSKRATANTYMTNGVISGAERVPVVDSTVRIHIGN